MLLIPNFQSMRLHALLKISSIRLQKSDGINSDSSCKERMTEEFGILNYQEGKEEQKL